jgi:hypothetical protein
MMLTLDVRSIVQVASEMDEPRPRCEDASRSISFEVLDADLLDALVRLVNEDAIAGTSERTDTIRFTESDASSIAAVRDARYTGGRSPRARRGRK